jgi:alkanesulfonate monooxygenase SsuD/methylene tetrahydromethanopterin reductase-like flavin-dependent oxidoreductase (luciferase family)
MRDNDANRELFEEQMEVLLKAFNEDAFSHHGKHYDIPPDVDYRGYRLRDVTLVPRPVHRPVEIWQAVSSGRSVAFMARNGIKGMVTLTGETVLDEWIRLHQAEAAAAGRTLELGEDLCWGVAVYLAESAEEAISRMEPFHDERYKWFEPFGIVRYVDEEGRPWGSPGAPSGAPSLRDGVAQKAWLCGTPESVIETIREVEARYPGLDQMMIHLPEGMPPSEFMEQLRRFARDVMPAFDEGVQGLPGHAQPVRR